MPDDVPTPQHPLDLPADLAIPQEAANEIAQLRAQVAALQMRSGQTSQHHFAVQVGPQPDQFIAKLDGQHITSILNAADGESKRNHSFKVLALCLGIVGFFALCSLFLYFDKSDLVEKILALFIGFVGGFGVGRIKK